MSTDNVQPSDALQDVTETTQSASNTQRKRTVWGGVEHGAVLPPDQELASFAKKEGVCRKDPSTWINDKDVFAGRLQPGAGYNFTLKAQGLTKSLNACHLTFALAYICAKGEDFSYEDLAADFLRLDQAPMPGDGNHEDVANFRAECKRKFGLLIKAKVDTHGLLSFREEFKRDLQAATASLQGHASSHQGPLSTQPVRAPVRKRRKLVAPAAAEDEEDDSVVCTSCGCPEDAPSMVLCDGCDAPWHISCLQPPLERIPVGNWYCPAEDCQEASQRYQQRHTRPQHRRGMPLNAQAGGLELIESEVAALDRPARSQPVRCVQQARQLQPPQQVAATVLEAARPASPDGPAAGTPAGASAGGVEQARVQLTAAQQLSTADASKLLERCLAAVKEGSGQRAALTKQVCSMLAVVFEDAGDSIQGQVKDAVEFWERVETCVQHLVDMRANTFRAYHPKLQRMVQWLVCSAAHDGKNAAHDADTLMSENKFISFLQWLQSGEDLQPVADEDIAAGEAFTAADARELEIPPPEVKEVRMGKETMKQYLAAAALLQQMQHRILFGDVLVPSITQGGMVKLKYLGIRHSENAKRMARFEDAAANAPQLDTEDKHDGLVENLINREDCREFVSGVRAFALYIFCLSTICRADEARSKLVCQQLIFDYPAKPDTVGCQQPLYASIFSMTSGKTNAGDTKEYRVAARHRNVYRCPLGGLAMWGITKHHVAKIPMPRVELGKPAYYDELIFAAYRATSQLSGSTHYQVLRQAQAAANFRNSGIVTHLTRHMAATTARVIWSQSTAELCSAGSWQKTVQQSTYSQVSSADSVANRAGYSCRENTALLRQLLSPEDFVEFQPMVPALYPGIEEKLAAQRAFNSQCSAKDRDTAGECVLEIYRRERIIFFQDLPWWFKRFGMIPVMRIAPLREFWKNGLLLKWMRIQYNYVSSLEGCYNLMMSGISLSLPQGASPRATIVNAILARKDAGGLQAMITLGQSAREGRSSQGATGGEQDSFIMGPLQGLAEDADGLHVRQVPANPILALPASPERLPQPALDMIVSPSCDRVEELTAPSRPRRSTAASRPSPDDAALLMSLRADAGAAQSSAQAAGTTCAVPSAQAQAQGAAIFEMQQKLNGLHFEMTSLRGSALATAMRTDQVANQNSQIIGMLAALQHQQLVSGMQATQVAGSGNELPMHLGVAKPRTKAEQARQRQAHRWAAQKQQQQAQQERQPALGGRAEVVQSHRSQAALTSQQEQPASILAGSSGAGASEEGRGAVEIPGQGSNPPWQEWEGDMKTITCKGASLNQIFADGVHGILLDREKGTHTLALMELEERFCGVGGRPKLRWRGQNKIGKEVSDRKMLLYAIFRRMDDAESSTAKGQGWRGFAAPCMGGRKQAAVRELEDLAASLYKGNSKSCEGESKSSLDQLCTALRRAPKACGAQGIRV